MTSLDKASLDKIVSTSIDRSSAAPDNHLAVELTETLRLAVPMALTQLGQIAMMTTDLALVGRLGDQAVAAAALASPCSLSASRSAWGWSSAVAPLAAQAFGARDPRMVRRALRVGLWAALLIALPMMAFPLRGEQILLALGQAPASAHLAQQYLFGLVWGIAPALWFIAIRGFMGAVNRPEPVLWITLVAIPANAVLVYLLIHGAWGLPRLELFGAGLAHLDRQYRHVPGGPVVRHRRRPFRKYHVLGRIWRIDWALMRKLVIVGAPISISFLLEYGLFGAAALLMGLISTTALAAHQIALQITAILFMVPFGIGMAATVRVGHAVGRNDAGAVRRAGFVAIAARHRFGRRPDARRDRRPGRDRALLFRRSCRQRGRRHRTHRDAADDRRDILHRRRHPDHRRRRASRHERHAGAVAVCRDQLLADRICQRLRGSPSGRRSARSASGSGCPCGTAVYAVLLVLRFHLLASRMASA